MNIKYRHLFCIICVTLFGQLYSQTTGNNQTDIIARSISEVSERKGVDMVYIQTNKDIYMSQEDLWFKGYVLDSQFFVPSLRSKMFYLQLLNDTSGKVVWEEKYEIENGFVDGHVYLDEKLTSGDYTLMAYTSHSFMKNREAFYATKKIKIFSIKKDEVIKDDAKDVNNTELEFEVFPEGGYLVADLENRLAFKGVNKKGYPIDVSGALYENDSLIKRFSSIHTGMGSFIFTPKYDQTYEIRIKNKSYALPNILPSGKTIQLNSLTKKYANLKVNRSADFQPEKVYVRLQVRGITYKVLIKTLQNKVDIIKIPLEEVPQGIAEVTLFDESLKPIAERLIYIGLDENLNIATNLSKERYETREKVILKINVKDDNDQPVVAHLGLSVFDKFYKDKTESKNILTHYCLSVQLRGNIFNPEHYFNKENKSRKRDLDLLLLTHGWRRYVWSETNLSKLQSKKHPVITDPLSGKFKVLYKEKDPKPYFVLVSSGNETKKTNYIQVDTKKNFQLKSEYLKLGQRGYVYLKPLGEGDTKDYKISISDVNADSINYYRNIKPTFYSYKSAPKSLFKEVTPFQYYDGTQNLEEVYIKKKKDAIYRDKLLGQLDSLQKSVPELDICVCHNGIVNCRNHCPFFGTQSKDPFEDHDRPLTEEELLEIHNLTAIKSFYGKRKFFNMTYDEETVNDPFPDKRNTLVWNPNLVTNTNGEAVVEFYCSDTNSEFIGVLEGVGGVGLLGYKDFSVKVSKWK